MSNRIINFASDNTAGAAPEVMAALGEAASAPAMPYGDDIFTQRLRDLANQVFEREVTIFPVATGTAANALSLATVSPPYGVVFCHAAAHIEEDECAAPEFYIGGGKLALLEGEEAKFSAESLRAKLEVTSPAPPVHHAQPAAVSITQATEVGALYSTDEIAAISAVCGDHGLALHMDGARLANAIAAQGVTPAEATWKAGVDVLSLGATKNGALSAEAVVGLGDGRYDLESCAAAGVRFIHIPFDTAASDPAVADHFLAEIAKPGTEPAFIHCAGGSRAAGVWMIKRVLVDGWDVARAEKEAEALGLTSRRVRQYALSYILAHND